VKIERNTSSLIHDWEGFAGDEKWGNERKPLENKWIYL
jgi:hypothetical protein